MQVVLHLQFPNSIYLMLVPSLLLMLHQPKCHLRIAASMVDYIKGHYCALLMMTTYVTLIDNMQENRNNFVFQIPFM